MPISINGSGTITGIAVGGIPDGVVDTDVIAANAVTTAKLGTDEASGLCKAWVNFNGTGTVAIRDSYNVSSITDNGVGDYTVNFTTAMPDANYTCAATCTARGGGGTPSVGRSVGFGSGSTTNTNGTYTTAAVQLYCQNSSGTVTDVPTVTAAVFR